MIPPTLTPLWPQLLARQAERFTTATVPEAEEARRWAEQELAKAEYLAAQPNAFDRASLAVLNFLGELFNLKLSGNGSGVVMLIVLTGVLLAALIIGVLVWGRPRAAHRQRTATELLGERDHHSAAELRRAAAACASAGDWAGAMTQQYRALARGLIERELLDAAPGATAQTIATSAARTFPSARTELLAAARRFDGVRYQGATGDSAGYAAIRAVDQQLMHARIAAPA